MDMLMIILISFIVSYGLGVWAVMLEIKRRDKTK